MFRRFYRFLVIFAVTITLLFSSLSSEAAGRIQLPLTEEGGSVVVGNTEVTILPDLDKAVAKVVFSAKAALQPDELFYPYEPLFKPPYTWEWATGEPWVPDGEYVLKADILYETGEVEAITKAVVVKNYERANAPSSPAGLDLLRGPDSKLELTWVVDDSPAFYNHEIYLNGEKIGETVANSYTVTNLAEDALYKLQVKTRDIYNNLSLDTNAIKVITNTEDAISLPSLSAIKIEGESVRTPEGGTYLGKITFSVSALNDAVSDAAFFVKMYGSAANYLKLIPVRKEGDEFFVAWDTTFVPDGEVIVKAEAQDEFGQLKTVSKVFSVNNTWEESFLPSWEVAGMPPKNYIIAYLAGWAPYSGYDILGDLDASRISHINYAFAKIDDELEVAFTDPVQDPINFPPLNELKKEHPHLKTIISIGGWADSGNFSEAAATEKARGVFTDSVIAFILEHGFDGVDLDWEYPVTGGGPGTSPNQADKKNFPLLLKAMREKLDELAEEKDRPFTLSIAGAANPSFVENTQIGWTHEYLDYVQVMTYDIHGTWESFADFTAPLYDDRGKTWSVDKAVQAYLEAGVPGEKLIMGVPFYGYKYKVTSKEDRGLRQAVTKSESIPYSTIVKLLGNGYQRHWNAGSAVPFLFSEEEMAFISHDDKESIALKARYIREQGLGGAMIWEISQDDGIELLDTLYRILRD